MVLARIIALAGLLMLGGCSYSYDILAKMIDGRVTFVVSPHSFRKPASCLTTVTVMALDRGTADATDATNGDPAAVEGIVWWNEVGRDCSTRFPVTYGVELVGSPISSEQAARQIDAKPLKPGIVYTVNVVSGATGYGGGRFRLTDNGTVENLPRNVR